MIEYIILMYGNVIMKPLTMYNLTQTNKTVENNSLAAPGSRQHWSLGCREQLCFKGSALVLCT
jgi:hypothetical protein